MTDKREPVNLTMPDRLYQRMNRAVIQEQGADLAVLADIFPALAYEVLGNKFIEVLTKGLPTTIDTESGITVNARLDGTEAQKGFVENRLRERIFPQIEFEEQDVIINVVKRRSLSDRLNRREPRKIKILEFTVLPGEV